MNALAVHGDLYVICDVTDVDHGMLSTLPGLDIDYVVCDVTDVDHGMLSTLPGLDIDITQRRHSLGTLSLSPPCRPQATGP